MDPIYLDFYSHKCSSDRNVSPNFQVTYLSLARDENYSNYIVGTSYEFQLKSQHIKYNVRHTRECQLIIKASVLKHVSRCNSDVLALKREKLILGVKKIASVIQLDLKPRYLHYKIKLCLNRVLLTWSAKTLGVPRCFHVLTYDFFLLTPRATTFGSFPLLSLSKSQTSTATIPASCLVSLVHPTIFVL